MEEANYLETIAEVAASFVGFAALVTAVRRRAGTSTDLEWIMISRLVERGLAAVAFALLPQLVHFLGYELQSSFSALSALLAIYFAVSFVRPFFLRGVAGGVFSGVFSGIGLVVRVGAAAVMIPVQGLAAFQVLPFPAPGLYVLGCAWLLMLSGLTFASVLALPHAARQAAEPDVD